MTATLTYRGTNFAASGSPHTYAAAPIGTASADRLVIVVICARRVSGVARQVTSVTIGGAAATIHVQQNDGGVLGSTTVAIASLLVTTGTTADVVVTYTNTIADTNIAVYTATGADSMFDTVSVIGAEASTSSPTNTLNVPAGGFIVAGFSGSLGTLGNLTMTGVTEDLDTTGSTMRFGTGSANGLSAQTDRTIAVSSSADFEALVAVSWGSSAPAGRTKVWNGSGWAVKPTKVWSGGAWVTKPVKVWNGSIWR